MIIVNVVHLSMFQRPSGQCQHVSSLSSISMLMICVPHHKIVNNRKTLEDTIICSGVMDCERRDTLDCYYKHACVGRLGKLLIRLCFLCKH